MKVLVIDNYDSFVFNVARYFVRQGAETTVVRNDAVSVDTIAADLPDAIVLSPGPCAPKDAGISSELVRRLSGKVPILGMVENMATFICPHCGGETDIFGHGGGEREAAAEGVPFLGRRWSTHPCRL